MRTHGHLVSTRICTTHVLADPADPRRAQQVRNVKAAASAGGLDVLLGGDFNLFPGSAELKPLSSAYEECDSLGNSRDEVTHHAWTSGKHVYRKRDHIFATKTGTSRLHLVRRRPVAHGPNRERAGQRPAERVLRPRATDRLPAGNVTRAPGAGGPVRAGSSPLATVPSLSWAG